MALRKLVSLVVPTSVAALAFLHAHAIGALVDDTAAPASIAPFAEARAEAASSGSGGPEKLAALILERKPTDPHGEDDTHLLGDVRSRHDRSWR